MELRANVLIHQLLAIGAAAWIRVYSQYTAFVCPNSKDNRWIPLTKRVQMRTWSWSFFICHLHIFRLVMWLIL